MITEFEYQINFNAGPSFNKEEYLKIFDEANGLEEYRIEPEVPGEITVTFTCSDSVFLEIQDKITEIDDEDFGNIDFITELEIEDEDSFPAED
jgi:hypothetical protein